MMGEHDDDTYRAYARDGTLKKSEKQPLPDFLFTEALERAEKLETWSFLVKGKAAPHLVLTQPDGVTFTAKFTTRRGKVDKVERVVKEAKK